MHEFMLDEGRGANFSSEQFLLKFSSTHQPDSRENVKRLPIMVSKKLKSHFIVLRAFYALYKSIYIL